MSAGSARCHEEELRELFLFEKLTPEQLTRLCRNGRVEWYDTGPVYREGEPAEDFYVLFEGTLVLSRLVAGQDVDVTRSCAPGVYAGAFQAYLGDQVPQVYNNSMRVTERSRFFVLPAAAFATVVRAWFPMAAHLLEGLFFGIRSTEEAVGQRERLQALGSVTDGLTDELDRPAAAAVRAAADLRQRTARVRHAFGAVAADPPGGGPDLERLGDLQDRAIDDIEQAVQRVSAFVGAAKQYAQLDRAPYQSADVHELLDSTLLLFRAKLGPDITVVRQYDGTLPSVPGFPAELNQVWSNLIDNAAWAMHSTGSGGTLTVRTARDGDRLLVEFRDTGPGVPAGVRDRVFDPFFTTRPVGEGTGLGLDICRRIVVVRHRGDLRLVSVPGDTRFQVRLPMTAEQAATALETAEET
ncbi:ATP-binding protein [Actinacidiphila acidipaludis]|uniref:histidine kinase n=1 Tax=Actinacidiphila acidipaludis TaxID=2873382 RepID=A0ABS7Q988_9ACTN|nr:ATP-binding protein [Streptomyces acidipaludis]MBY8879716.1 histidine kinase [Streptomyces acidipaludis]